MDIRDGTIFDTLFESRCRAVEEPNALGWFDAYDSEGTLCRFFLAMVSRIHDTEKGEES